MEEETPIESGAQEAPSTDVATPVMTVEPDVATELADDYANIDALIEQARQAAMAEVTEEPAPAEAATTVADAAPAPEAATPAEHPKTAEPDYAALLADLQAKGYKVEAPAPPPDPYESLMSDLQAERGTDEAYAEAKQKALQFVPAEPAAYDAASVKAHEELVKERNEAAAKLQEYDRARRISDRSRAWARDWALGQVGQSFAQLPETYQLAPERAKRVTDPQSATDAVAAVVETVTERVNADWQQRYDARERYWQGEVARAKADASADGLARLGRAPQPNAPAGGKPANGPFSALFADPKGMPPDDVIDRAKKGEFAGLDLG